MEGLHIPALIDKGLSALQSTGLLGKKWIQENPRIAAISAIAAAAMVLTAIIYQKLQRGLPFDSWQVTLGISSRKEFTPEEKNKLSQELGPLAALPKEHAPTPSPALLELAEKYGPVDFVQRLFSFALSKQEALSAEDVKPKSPLEWLHWMQSACKVELLSQAAKSIYPVFIENPSRPREEENALLVQNWVTTLQTWALFIGFESAAWTKSLFSTVQNSPRHAYSILFSFSAPYAANLFWEALKENLPPEIQETGNKYLNHKLKIAFLALAGTTFLYSLMNKEKGLITDLTQQFIDFKGSHRCFDLLPTYAQQIHELLCRIGSTNPGQSGSNIFWYYHQDQHGTIPGAIGEVLGEMTAAGRVHENQRDVSRFPRLENLKIWSLDIGALLAEYPDPDSIGRGWRQVITNITKEKNVLVVLKNLSQIQDYLLRSSAGRHGSEEGGREAPYYGGAQAPSEARLARLLLASLQTGEFRCLIEADEDVKAILDKKFEMAAYFTSLRSPNIPVKELYSHFKHLYCSPGRISAISENEIEMWLIRLHNYLDINPQSPLALMDSIQDTLRKWEGDLRRLPPGIPEERIRDWQGHMLSLEKTSHDLNESVSLMEQLFQRKWRQRNRLTPESKFYEAALLILQSVVLPIYHERMLQAKAKLIPQGTSVKERLIDTAQVRFQRLFGSHTNVEQARLLALPKILGKEIKGQHIALEQICNAVRKWRAVPPRDGKPLVLFFTGPTGVGKSKTATELAFHLNSVFGVTEGANFSDEHNVLRVRLENKKPGIFGWSEIRDRILNQIDEDPLSVIILEEWDKMDDNDRVSLLELLEGTQTYIDANPRFGINHAKFVYRSSSIFIFTSNVAANELSTPIMDIKEDSKTVLAKDLQHIKTGMKKYFDKNETGFNAFLSRIDAIIPFHGFPRPAVEEMLKTNLDKFVADQTITKEESALILTKLILHVNSMDTKNSDGRDWGRLVQDEIHEYKEEQRKANALLVHGT